MTDDDEAKERLRKFMEALAAAHEHNDVTPWASGGPVQGGKPYLIGDRGPELFRPTTDGYIDPLAPSDEPEGEEP